MILSSSDSPLSGHRLIPPSLRVLPDFITSSLTLAINFILLWLTVNDQQLLINNVTLFTCLCLDFSFLVCSTLIGRCFTFYLNAIFFFTLYKTIVVKLTCLFIYLFFWSFCFVKCSDEQERTTATLSSKHEISFGRFYKCKIKCSFFLLLGWTNPVVHKRFWISLCYPRGNAKRADMFAQILYCITIKMWLQNKFLHNATFSSFLFRLPSSQIQFMQSNWGIYFIYTSSKLKQNISFPTLFIYSVLFVWPEHFHAFVTSWHVCCMNVCDIAFCILRKKAVAALGATMPSHYLM